MPTIIRELARVSLNCHHFLEPGNKEPDDEQGELIVTPDNQTLKICNFGSKCYTLWQEIDNRTVVKRQGCWDDRHVDCARSECVSQKKPIGEFKSRFCCCDTNFCNANVTDGYVPVDESKLLDHGNEESFFKDRYVVMSCLFMSLLTVFSLILIVLYMFKSYKNVQKKKRAVSENHLLINHSMADSMSADNLTVTNMIGKGKFGSVWKGEISGKDIAVKIFPSHYRNFFINERNVYALPFMTHPNILHYFGSSERLNASGETEYLLMVAYAPHGCLQEYLKNNILDMEIFCKMAEGISKGLAHLHSEILRGDELKPCISHRDINSRNILVKKDLTCCICDLGLAITLSDTRHADADDKHYAKNKSLNEVGTMRYMAPEILEGSVNLNDCELSLKEIDVYALGLVIWEMATRCSSFYQTIEIPEYELPFKHELGQNANMEIMQTLVSYNKVRPMFPKMWYNNGVVEQLKAIIEDCWDDDPDARLSANCVAERVNQLPALHKKSTIGNCNDVEASNNYKNAQQLGDYANEINAEEELQRLTAASDRF